MRLKGIRSLRELTRILDVDRRLRRLSLIHGDQRGYPRSVISRFTRRVGADVLQLILEEKVVELLRFRAPEVDVLLDASFIKARSIRHPDNSRVAYSDPDALVGRNGRGYDLGYKLHVAVDHRTMLPLATLLAPANDNEKKHAPGLVEKARAVLVRAGGLVRSLVADSQYSSRAVRGLVSDSVIPYTANQTRPLVTGYWSICRVQPALRRAATTREASTVPGWPAARSPTPPPPPPLPVFRPGPPPPRSELPAAGWLGQRFLRAVLQDQSMRSGS